MALSHFGRATMNRKVLIMISDGGDNSSRAALPDILRWAQKSGVAFYCIGLFDKEDTDSNPRVLNEFADLTGGKAFFPSDVHDTTKICMAIAREIRSQYTLGFTGAEDGKYHRIKVTAQDPGYSGCRFGPDRDISRPSREPNESQTAKNKSSTMTRHRP
jgi:Ca-activated chloride channel family protein